MANINDVAKKAGVGRGTVSRVINNSSLVADETREKVLKAINELSYHPSKVARGLATYSSFTIGFIMDNTMDKAYANPFIYEVFRGIEKNIYENGYNLLLLGKDTYQNDRLAVESVLEEKMLDGLILPQQIVESDYFNNIKRFNLPIVSIGKLEKIQDISWVDIDNYMAGYKAAEYLYNCGYRKITFYGYEPEKLFAKERYFGYLKLIKEKKLNVHTVVDEDFSNMDAIICIDNIWAYKALQEIKKINKRIPQDVGIITFDNYPLAEYLDPTVTNVEIDLYELGIKAGEEILRQVKFKEGGIKKIKIPVCINIRKSTK